MKDKSAWFEEKLKDVPEQTLEEVRLSAAVIRRVDEIMKRKGMTQRDLARKLGKSEAVVSRWTTGFPNLTLCSISQISCALGEPIITVPE